MFSGFFFKNSSTSIETMAADKGWAFRQKDPDLKRELASRQLLLGMFHTSMLNLVEQKLENSRLIVFDHFYFPRAIVLYRLNQRVRVKVVLIENLAWDWPWFSLIEREDANWLELSSGHTSMMLTEDRLAQRFRFYVDRKSEKLGEDMLTPAISSLFRSSLKKRVKGSGPYLMMAYVPEEPLHASQKDVTKGFQLGVRLYNAFGALHDQRSRL